MRPPWCRGRDQTKVRGTSLELRGRSEKANRKREGGKEEGDLGFWLATRVSCASEPRRFLSLPDDSCRHRARRDWLPRRDASRRAAASYGGGRSRRVRWWMGFFRAHTGVSPLPAGRRGGRTS